MSRVRYGSSGGSEPGWQAVIVSFNATATPIAVNPGTVLWTPPSPGLVRAFTANDDISSPLVGNGGATTLAIGIDGNILNIIPANTFASYAQTQFVGWGRQGPVPTVGDNSTGDSGIVVCPAGSVRGRPLCQRLIRGYANLGTITGLLQIRFEFRPFVGGIF